MAEKTKDELKRDKAARLNIMIDSAVEMLQDLKDDIKLWSGDNEVSAEDSIKHQMHQNETIANLQFLIDYLLNKQRRS